MFDPKDNPSCLNRYSDMNWLDWWVRQASVFLVHLKLV
jgi:hypothetical protein